MAGISENSAFTRFNNRVTDLISSLRYSDGFESIIYVAMNDTLIMYKKRSNEFTEYQHPEPTVFRSPKNDRVHPLDTVSILEFRTDHKRDVEEVFVHSGKYADELARSFNAMAITMASHIV